MRLLRLALYRVLWLRTEATIQASAQESSIFIETVRAMQSLKLFNRESEREGQWLNRYAEVANANVRLGRDEDRVQHHERADLRTRDRPHGLSRGAARARRTLSQSA